MAWYFISEALLLCGHVIAIARPEPDRSNPTNGKKYLDILLHAVSGYPIINSSGRNDADRNERGNIVAAYVNTDKKESHIAVQVNALIEQYANDYAKLVAEAEKRGKTAMLARFSTPDQVVAQAQRMSGNAGAALIGVRDNIARVAQYIK